MSWYATSSSSTSTDYTPYFSKVKKVITNEIKDELIKISEEVEEERQKNLPRFDPKDLDI